MKRFNIISYIIMILSFIILSYGILKLDILPSMYLIIYFSIIGVLSIIFGLITFLNKNKIIRWIITILLILISILSFVFLFVYLDKTNDFFENII